MAPQKFTFGIALLTVGSNTFSYPKGILNVTYVSTLSLIKLTMTSINGRQYDIIKLTEVEAIELTQNQLTFGLKRSIDLNRIGIKLQKEKDETTTVFFDFEETCSAELVDDFRAEIRKKVPVPIVKSLAQLKPASKGQAAKIPTVPKVKKATMDEDGYVMGDFVKSTEFRDMTFPMPPVLNPSTNSYSVITYQ